jgi:HK97 family phage major capsid protein
MEEMHPSITTAQLKEIVRERAEKAQDVQSAFETFKSKLVEEHGADKIAGDKQLFDRLQKRHDEVKAAQKSLDEARNSYTYQLEVDNVIGAKTNKALDVTAGGTLPFPGRTDGIRALPQRELFLRDLVNLETTDGDKADYVRETAFTNNAAPTAAGALKPTTVENLERVTARVSPIAHVSEAVDRYLVEDNGQIDPFLKQRMILGVLLAEEVQMISGNGAYPNLGGILTTAGIQTQAMGADDRGTAIFKAITLIKLQFADPDGIVLHPSDWQDVRTTKNANNDWVLAPMIEEAPDRLFGIPVLQSPAIAAGTGLVGAFKAGAQLWIRENPVVAIAETGLGNAAGEEMFSRNQVRYRAEERVAFGVIRPALFCTVTGI